MDSVISEDEGNVGQLTLVLEGVQGDDVVVVRPRQAVRLVEPEVVFGEAVALRSGDVLLALRIANVLALLRQSETNMMDRHSDSWFGNKWHICIITVFNHIFGLDAWKQVSFIQIHIDHRAKQSVKPKF